MEESSIEIRPAGAKGRGVFATQEFKEGDIIFQEVPLVSCQFAWNQDYGYAACDYCLRPLETALENVQRLSMNAILTIPYAELCAVDKAKQTLCPLCGVKYCGTECQQSAWDSYHRTLCLQKKDQDKSHPLELLKETWKEMHYPPETTSVMLLSRIFAVIDQAQNKEDIIRKFNQFCQHIVNEEEVISHNVLGLKFAEQINILREGLLSCVPTEHAKQWITPDGFLSLVALVGLNGQGIGTSAISEWVKNTSNLDIASDEKNAIDNFITKVYDELDKVVGEFLNNEGSGLYSLQSTINHSCTPNAEVTFPNANHQLAVKALHQIQPDDEICISYLDECILERSRHTRQKILRGNYLFSCTCPKCETQTADEDVTSEDEDDDEDEDEDNK